MNFWKLHADAGDQERVGGAGHGGKNQRRTLWRGGRRGYLDCGDGFPGTYMSNLIRFYTLNMCASLYASSTSMTGATHFE